MDGINITKQIRVEKSKGLDGGIEAAATMKKVTVRLRVSAIPERGGFIELTLPWGKIYGLAKKALGKAGDNGK